MKTKHIFIPVYTLISILILMYLGLKTNFNKLQLVDVSLILFVSINALFLATIFYEFISQKWDDTIFEKNKKRWH